MAGSKMWPQSALPESVRSFELWSGICQGADTAPARNARLRFRRFAAIVLPILVAFIAAEHESHAATKKPKVTIGRLEKVYIREAAVILTAKIDTGTQSSSVNARDIAMVNRGGRTWVRFTVEASGVRPVTLERPLVRFAKFKANARAQPKRPVVELGLCISTLYRRTQVNLVNRSRFRYPVLIGRRFLFGHAVVDTEKKFTADPACDEINAGR